MSKLKNKFKDLYGKTKDKELINEGQFSMGFLKKLWTMFFYLLEKFYKIIIFVAVVVGIHYAFVIIANRSIFLLSEARAKMGNPISAPDEKLLYTIARWKVPPIIGPSLIVIPAFIYKIIYKIRHFL